MLAGSSPDPILGPPTLSVGRIEGGQSVNVVPDWCEIEVDRRLIPGEDAATALDTVRQLVNKIFDEPDCLEVSQPWVHMPPLVSQASRWIEPLTVAIERATVHRPQVDRCSVRNRCGPD